MTVRCLLWDFGDTLCDERFIWSSGPEWQNAYDRFDDGFADDWNTGRMDDLAFARELTQYISMTAEEIVAHMRDCCGHIEFYEFTYSFFRNKRLPQAIVTVNPSLWSEFISPRYALHEVADVIVTSWEEGTTHKGLLCNVALGRFAETFEPGESLLIDNKAANIDAWKAKGGLGYQFVDDAQFERDVASGLDALAT